MYLNKKLLFQVAELYKHMEDRGQPINKNPTIDGREVDLYRLFKVVYKAGGQARVTNKNMWQQVLYNYLLLITNQL